jgi:hypothetical protein
MVKAFVSAKAWEVMHPNGEVVIPQSQLKAVERLTARINDKRTIVSVMVTHGAQ